MTGAGPVVVKIGGRALEGSGAPEQLAAEVASLGGAMVLVHGGGREVSDWCERLAIAPRFEDGLRVTDLQTLEVAVAVLSGLANKRLVALLRHAGVDAVGLSAVDGGVAELEPHRDADRLGEVGRVREVHPELLHALLARHQVPVLSSIGAWRGRLLNLNADELAASLALSLGAPLLVLLSDVEGVRLGGRLVPRLAGAELDEALAHPEVRDGMAVKLRAARLALERGVPTVRIAAWGGEGTLAALVAGNGPGTSIEAAASEVSARD